MISAQVAQNVAPFNYHINALFKPDGVKDPLLIEIQLWMTSIMELNDVSHAQYEVSRAATPGDI